MFSTGVALGVTRAGHGSEFSSTFSKLQDG